MTFDNPVNFSYQFCYIVDKRHENNHNRRLKPLVFTPLSQTLILTSYFSVWFAALQSVPNNLKIHCSAVASLEFFPLLKQMRMTLTWWSCRKRQWSIFIYYTKVNVLCVHVLRYKCYTIGRRDRTCPSLCW